MKLLNLKSGLLLLAIGSLSACGGSGGSSDQTGASATASITGPGVSGSGSLDVVVNNVDTLNKARYLNGAQLVEVDLTGTLKGSVTVDGITHSINRTESGKVDLLASDVRNAAGIPESYNWSETYCEDNLCYEVSASFDINQGKLRTDIAVVPGYYGQDFFITNEGTGNSVVLTAEQETARNDLFDRNVENLSELDIEFYNDLVDAHNDGWTGSGISLYTYADEDYTPTYIETLLPNAEVFYDRNDYSSVFSINHSDGVNITDVDLGVNHETGWLDGYYIDGEEGVVNHDIIAVGVGTVWNKFDTLTANQVVNLVEATSDGKRFDLGAALSPVGNLN